MTFGLLIGIALISTVMLRLIQGFPLVKAIAVHNLDECREVTCAVSPNHHGPPGSYSPPPGVPRIRQKP